MDAAFPDGNARGGSAAAAAWRDGWYWSADGIRLHWCERPATGAAATRPALLCLPGLTRNAHDFTALGDRLAGRFRVIAVDLRGRGESAWPKDSLTYVAMSYLHDLGRLLEAAQVERFIVLGSSVGGLLALQMVRRTAPAWPGSS